MYIESGTNSCVISHSVITNTIHCDLASDSG